MTVVRTMSRAELAVVLGWAADDGTWLTVIPAMLVVAALHDVLFSLRSSGSSRSFSRYQLTGSALSAAICSLYFSRADLSSAAASSN